MEITAAAVVCLAQAIYFEARGEKLADRLQVANVVMNRVESPRYPDDVCGVVRQKHQFEFYWDGEPERITEPEAWTDAVMWSMRYLERPMRYHNACHYVATNVFTNHNPSWAQQMEAFESGGHRFFEGGC